MVFSFHLLKKFYQLSIYTPFTRNFFFQEEMDEESSDEEGYTIISGARHRRSNPNRWCFDPNVDIVMPEDVTDKMLDNVVGKIWGLKTRAKLY